MAVDHGRDSGHIKCVDSLDCRQIDIACYPGVPFFIECGLPDSDDSQFCELSKIYGNGSSIFNITINGLYSAIYPDIYATDNGPTYVNANGGDAYVNHNANIWGFERNLIELKNHKFDTFNCPCACGALLSRESGRINFM